MNPPVLSQAALDAIAADIRAHAKMPPAFWVMFGLGMLGAISFAVVVL